MIDLGKREPIHSIEIRQQEGNYRASFARGIGSAQLDVNFDANAGDRTYEFMLSLGEQVSSNQVQAIIFTHSSKHPSNYYPELGEALLISLRTSANDYLSIDYRNKNQIDSLKERQKPQSFVQVQKAIESVLYTNSYFEFDKATGLSGDLIREPFVMLLSFYKENNLFLYIISIDNNCMEEESPFEMTILDQAKSPLTFNNENSIDSTPDTHSFTIMEAIIKPEDTAATTGGLAKRINKLLKRHVYTPKSVSVHISTIKSTEIPVIEN